MVAQPEEEQRRGACYRPGADRPAAPGDPVAQRVERGVHHVGGQSLDDRVGARKIDLAFRNGQLKARRERLDPATRVAERGLVGQLRGDAPILPSDEPSVRPDRLDGKPLDIHRRAHRRAHGIPLARDFGHADRALRKDRARPPLAGGNVLPLGVQRFDRIGHEIKGQLPRIRSPGRAPPAEQQPFHQRLHDLAGVAGQRHRDAERGADRLVLAQEHVEDNAVDLVVQAIVGHRAHGGPGLPKAVHASLALLVAGGVPAQVIVHHGVKAFLEVDALAQAVGGDQDAPGVRPELLDAELALGGRQCARHRGDLDAPGQGFPQFLGHVLGGGDKAAEQDRAVPVLQQLFRDRRRLGQLGVVRRTLEPVRAACVAQQPFARRRGSTRGTLAQCVRPVPGLRILQRPRRGVEQLGRVHVVQVEDCALADHVGLTHGLCVRCARPRAQRRRSGSRAAGQAAQQRQRRPPAHALPVARTRGIGHALARILEDGLKEPGVLVGQDIGLFGLLALWEGRIRAQIVAHVCAPALHEVRGDLSPVGLVVAAR